jgi:putative ABC transport system permease protein
LRSVTPGYFALLGSLIVDGRDFRSTDDRKAPGVAIVNRTFAARYFPGTTTVGKKLHFGVMAAPGPATEVIGVVSDSRTGDLAHDPEPEIYLSLWQASAFSKDLVLRTSADPRSVMAAAQRELHAVDPTVAVENVRTLDQIRSESLASRTFAMQLLVGFSAIGSTLTLVGIYGVVALSVASRRREIAIRSAIGAKTRDIRSLFFVEGFRLIVVGVGAGLLGALAVSRVLRSFLFAVDSSDPITLAAAAALFAGIGLLACWVPTRRAARIDPLEALRSE